MKKIQVELYEPGDHIMVLTGYNKGKVGTVVKHPNASSDVAYRLVGKQYDEEDEDDDYDWDEDDGSYSGEYDSSAPKYIRYITKKVYEETIRELKILQVAGLPVSIQYRNNSFIIGDNVVTAANAKKLATFITQNTKTTKKGKK